MQKITLHYGKEQVTLGFDGAATVTTITPQPADAIADVKENLIYEMCQNPVGCAPINELVTGQDLVTIVISDITRFWSRQDLVLEVLVKYLHEHIGLPYENMVVLVALGTHRGQSEKELKIIAGEEVYKKVQVLCHDCEGELCFVGTTSYGTPVWVNPLAVGRKVITIGATVHHLMSGFGGGRKSILPGIAGKTTVVHNHMLCLDPDKPKSSEKIGIGKLTGNPVHEDMCEAAAMVGPAFGINIVVNGQGRQAAFVCGHHQKAWEKSCDLVQKLSGVAIKEKADIVVGSCGGYPKDIDLYQGVKTLLNMGQAVKDGGTLVFLCEAPDGGGAPDFFDWSRSLKTDSLDADLRAGFTIAGYIFYAGCEVMKKARVLMLTKLDPAILADMGIEGFTDVETLAAKLDFTEKSVLVMPAGGSTVPYIAE